MSQKPSSKKPVHLPPAKTFPYSATPMVNHFPGNAEDCFDMVNQYGTYEIQRTADTGNFFPAIAQGLPKDAHFKIGRTELDQTAKSKGPPAMPGSFFILNPGFPDLRAVAHGRLLSVADDGRFHELRIVEDLVFLCRLIVHVAHKVDLRRFLLPSQ